jgi:hypothetical protein
LKRAAYLQQLVAGPYHPAVCRFYYKLGLLARSADNLPLTLKYMNEALKRCGNRKLMEAEVMMMLLMLMCVDCSIIISMKPHTFIVVTCNNNNLPLLPYFYY